MFFKVLCSILPIIFFVGEVTEMPFDWQKCIICQEFTKEALKCPLNSHGSPEANRQTYADFLQNAKRFREANMLPINLTFSDDVNVESLCTNQASWHKSCRLKFSLSKLEKAQKRGNRKRSQDNQTKDGEENAAPKCRKRQSVEEERSTCIFCERDDEEKLRSFSVLETDRNIRQMALELKDFELLGRISEGDLIAIEAKYHLKCMITLRNRYRSLCSRKAKESGDGADDERMDESVAFVELVEFIEGCVENGTHLFKLSELSSLYTQRLQDVGINKIINKTRLKNALLDHYTGVLQEQTDGRNTVLVFQEAISSLLKDALKQRDFSEDAEILARAATIVRKDIFSHNCFNFSGCFPLDCQSKCLPSSLKSLVSMLLNGLDIKDQDKSESQACLTVCQTIVFNTKKRSYKTKTDQTRHSASREPPIPLYIGLNIHSSTRSKALVEKMYQMGISVSYDRIMEIEDWLATSLCQRFKDDGCVSPACLRKGIFSVGALDNLDHNPSSTTSVSSFHGTGISIFQFPTNSVPGQSRPPLEVPPSTTEHQGLPESYATVPVVALNTSSVSVPARNTTPFCGDVSIEDARQQEDRWMSHALTKLSKDDVTAEDCIAWAAYHSSNQLLTNDPPAITALLPLFYEKADTPAMVKHGMNVLREATLFLNPGQIPVITLDQPLFALAKAIQWKWPAEYGENNYVVMFGGLHLEMTMWSTVGDLLDGSGWSTILTEAEVASSGIAQGLLKASHLTRTR